MIFGASMLKATLNKFGKKRVVAIAILAVGAIGATHLPTRTVETVADRSEVRSNGEPSVVFGTNSLLGDHNIDLDGAARAAEVSQDHLISCMSLSHAGDSTLLGELRGLTRATDGSKLSIAGMAGTSIGEAGVTAAVPEPAAAGLLATMVVPALLRRRRSGC